MLKYHATQYFIEAYNSVANTYPVNNTLLKVALQYQNITVFNHLLANTNMSLSPNLALELQYVIKSGSADLLRSYHAITGRRSVSLCMNNLLEAIKHNDVEFVRQLIQISGPLSKMDTNLGYPTQLPSIDVEMISILNNECDGILYTQSVATMILERCKKDCDADTVQYVLDNMPPHFNQAHHFVSAITNGIYRSLQKGHLQHLQALLHTPTGIKYLESTSGGGLPKYLERNIIEHLLSIEYANTISSDKQSLLNQMMAVELGSLSPSTLSYTPLVPFHRALEMNDDTLAMAILDNNEDAFGMESKVWKSRSLKQWSFFARLRPNFQHPINPETLDDLINATGEGHLSPDLAVTYLRSSTISQDEFEQKTGMINRSAAISLSLMQAVHDLTNMPYTYKCLYRAIKYKCEDSMTYLLELHQQRQLHNGDYDDERAQRAMGEMVEHCNTTIDTIELVRRYIPDLVSQPQLCVDAVENFEVFKHLLSMHSIEALDQVVAEIISNACQSDRPEVIELLQQYFKDKPLPLPSYESLMTATLSNSHHILEHYFVTHRSLLNAMPRLQYHRTILSILKMSYERGFTRIILMCNPLLEDIRSNKKRKYPDSQCLVEGPGATPQTQSAIHSVLSNNKLILNIMSQVRIIHRVSLGIDQRNLIKGRQLLDNHSLLSYIKYGAVEWFINAFNTMVDHRSIISLGETLLTCATNRCDIPILESLIQCAYINTSSSLPINPLVEHLSNCAHPHWDTILEEIELLSPSTIRYLLSDWHLIKSTLFLRKLLSLSASQLTSELPKGQMYRNSNQPSTDSLEMLKFLIRSNLIKPHSTCGHLLSLDNQLIAQYLVDTYPETFNSLSEILKYCYSLHPEVLNILLTSFTVNDTDLISTFTNAVTHGNMETVRFLSPYLEQRGCYDKIDILTMVQSALTVGSLDLIDFILSVSEKDLVDRQHNYIGINDVHPKIISIELIERLRTIPRLRISYDLFLARAITGGKRDVIEMLIQTQFQVSKYQRVLAAAADVGDVVSAAMIMEKNVVCTPLLFLHNAGCYVVEGQPYKWAKVHPEVGMLIAKYYQDKGQTITWNEWFDMVMAWICGPSHLPSSNYGTLDFMVSKPTLRTQ
ncbi:hypothetical protein SAMD00019534_050320 [Acytostelium subglobosum LB1]|uniref:hypothetical protein n=1 Tax=Acytostelium subglobosum LB1 TaxID=1410327 RepID=UPI000644E2E6|nr:hypothetical protein SAMD00019534_050320 [Acytostelium subglobosum LB1]GAM21857.1 hypothetical protein SAMD00019534_050320 [Acytostelium subglobosum LB1]|eukprot:XP_012754957.1 hypothetical protein SAMD00019534_050320 [Acytostelium subglobosum LB1]